MRGTDPPRCAAHGGGSRPGAPAGDAGAAPGLTGQLEDLDRRIQNLGDYIDAHRDELDVDDYCRLLELQSTLMGRATRMRQAQSQLEGGAPGELLDAINQALDEISAERGIAV